MAESNFDIIEALLTKFSGNWTGRNISRQIFSNLNFASLMEARLVCKSWNKYLNEDRELWLKILKETKPYLEHLNIKFCSGGCENSCKEMAVNWTNFFNFCDKAKLDFVTIMGLFRKIQGIYAVIEDKWSYHFHYLCTNHLV